MYVLVGVSTSCLYSKPYISICKGVFVIFFDKSRNLGRLYGYNLDMVRLSTVNIFYKNF